MGPQRSPKWSSKSIKIEHEHNDKIRRLSNPSWIRPGTVLGRFGVDLGSKITEFRWFYKGSVNIMCLKKIRLRSASWTDLGSILTPKGVPKGSQIGPKMDPKCDRKTIKK